jgi:alginate O-acetyltransferase complex protein AlgI
MWITMLLSGLWHGAAWTFIIWGAIHALFLSIERVTRWPEHLKKFRFGSVAALAIVMAQVAFAWVFFRSADLHQALHIARGMLELNVPKISVSGAGLLFLALAVGREVYCWNWEGRPAWMSLRTAVVAEMAWYACIISCVVFLRGPGASFIYFQF